MEWTKGSSAKGEMLSRRKPAIGPHVISKTNYCVWLIVAAYIHLCFYLNIQLDH